MAYFFHMVDDVEESRDASYWERRIGQMSREHIQLVEFILKGEREGTVSQEASRAYFKAANSALHRAGLLGGQAIKKNPAVIEGGRDRDMACVVFEQSLHEAREALLQVQPELRQELEKKAPPSKKDGRSR